MIELCNALQKRFSAPDIFDQIMNLEGETFRNHKGRRTLRFVHEGKGFFLKTHPGVGWREIFKNLIYLRLPVLGARHERDAILCLERLNVATMKIAGYGMRGRNPASLESFLITEEIDNAVSLEDLVKTWENQPLEPRMKRALIKKIACIANTLHQNGVNHRDFYLCHFLLEWSWLKKGDHFISPPLHVIDLHRTQIRPHTPERWVIKDLAGLYFSSMDAGLTNRDIYRFIRIYTGKSLKKIFCKDKNFWEVVSRRAHKTYVKFN